MVVIVQIFLSVIKIAICDWAWENRSYLHKIHLFVLWHIYSLLYIATVYDIQNLLVLLNISWMAVYMMTFYIQYGLQIKSYYILNSQNQVKLYNLWKAQFFQAWLHIKKLLLTNLTRYYVDYGS